MKTVWLSTYIPTDTGEVVAAFPIESSAVRCQLENPDEKAVGVTQILVFDDYADYVKYRRDLAMKAVDASFPAGWE